MTIASIEGGVAPLIEAQTVINAFHAMIRKRAGDKLDPWIERAHSSLVASFANDVAKDKRAIGAAIASHWSNGQTEGQIAKLKLVKRQVYGRAKIDLLEARLIPTVIRTDPHGPIRAIRLILWCRGAPPVCSRPRT